MPNTTYYGVLYVTPYDPAYFDAWGTPLNNQAIFWDEVCAKLQFPIEILSPEERDYRLVTKSRWPMTIHSATFETDAGTVTAAIKINATSVTGLSAVSVTSTEATTSASGANAVAEGDNVTLSLSSVVGVGALRLNLWLNRTGAGSV